LGRGKSNAAVRAEPNASIEAVTRTQYQYQQIDVFSLEPLKGNPLAVVIAADRLTDDQMLAFANWTNLSETSFLLKPTDRKADYRVRIFTPERELPFAGHPTLGSCHVWLKSGGNPKAAEILQECGIGLVRIVRDADRLAFAAPPLRRYGTVEAKTLTQIAGSLGIPVTAITASSWVDNGPGWVAIMLATRDEVLALKPDYAAMAGLSIGVVAPWQNTDAQFEVRAFMPGVSAEDPVTGSLNAGLAQWLISARLAPTQYVASQGTVLGRAGRVHISQFGNEIWVGGHTVTRIEGTLTL
jgi:PhzF family phenazine biosynthesis protein